MSPTRTTRDLNKVTFLFLSFARLRCFVFSEVSCLLALLCFLSWSAFPAWGALTAWGALPAWLRCFACLKCLFAVLCSLEMLCLLEVLDCVAFAYLQLMLIVLVKDGAYWFKCVFARFTEESRSQQVLLKSRKKIGVTTYFSKIINQLYF